MTEIVTKEMEAFRKKLDELGVTDWVNNICDGNRTVENLNTYLTCQEQLRELRRMFGGMVLPELVGLANGI